MYVSCRLIYFASYVTAKLKVNHYSNLINPTLHLLALRGILLNLFAYESTNSAKPISCGSQLAAACRLGRRKTWREFDVETAKFANFLSHNEVLVS